MIARFATSPPVHDPDIEAKQRENVQQRLKPALIDSPGFHGAIWLKHQDGTVHSITLWQSEEAMRAAQQAVQTPPLVAGHQPEDLPGPARGQVVEIAEVIEYAFPDQTGG